ncbi:serine hydrolase domain-containing protein [Neptunitalea lumnitzerae]|uniref:Beta-lactamase-related domain-containing protein n=1 Tax=Neptunitalea lumnitzerae TaxID=2965509 RepID=A0ABQ5MGE3_9FLAO|nr:serine hydrolase domain-containing protein [Neptunitalea sp. Y10]GLB48486.1 hypothetical protein Y10_08540 [Neptunitalea sp. Y10]
MKFIQKTTLVLLLSVFLITSCTSPNKPTPQDTFKQQHPEFATKFEDKVSNIYKDKNLHGDILFAIVNEQGIAYSFTLNRELLNGTPTDLNLDSPIYIASSTKSFTGTLLKILEEEGTLDLNSSLHKNLPQLTYQNEIDTEAISLKNLLNHTHGTFSTSMAWKTAYLGYSGNNEELISDLNTDFLYDPSGKFRYSNIGPIIAGLVVDYNTNKTWKSQMETKIFDPLKMSNTSANVSDFKFETIRPSLLCSNDSIILKSFDKTDFTMHAAGGIISTMNDMAKWMSANIRQDSLLLTQENWKDLHEPTTEQDRTYFTYKRTGYSLGWDIANYQNEKILTRFGNLGGITFHSSFMPDRKIGIIAFSNDNRAYLLPHLIANYAYNLLNTKDADSIFNTEVVDFNKSYTKENNIAYPSQSDLAKDNKENDRLIGTYKSTKNWPNITITKEDRCYYFTWGTLKGKIYNNPSGGFTSSTGVLKRNFNVENNTLHTGSLEYKKIE